MAFPFLATVYLTALIGWAIYGKKDHGLQWVVYSVFGQIYITLPLSVLMLIFYRFTDLSSQYSQLPLLLIFTTIWINDTAAYLVGSLIGKHKFAERISPKKTVEGLAGGMLFSVAATTVAAHFLALPLIFGAISGLLISFFGTMGDLFESLIKRTCHIKDSGNLIPGHGGILDRIDSLLVVVPVMYIYLSIALPRLMN